MAILGTPIIDLWCERKLNENGTHTATLKWNPSYAKVNIYRKKDTNNTCGYTKNHPFNYE